MFLLIFFPTILSKSYPGISPLPGRLAQISESEITWPELKSASATIDDLANL